MRVHILIVEDNAGNLELMRYLLEAFDYRASVVSAGEAAVAAARLHRPDLILCDIQLPGIDGYEVLRRIREDADLVATPVVAVTALAMVGDRDKVLAAGFNGYLSKPIDPETFVWEVESFLAAGLRNARRFARAFEASAPPPAAAAPGRTILAVDNLKVNLDLIADLFGRSGYRVITAPGQRQARQLAQRSAPDLILSDVCMPEGSGYELIAAIKADPRLSRIPFVFLTSTFINENDRRKGLAMGAMKFLLRPIDPQDLLREIDSCFPKAGGA